MQGERPPRPTHPAFTEELWALTQRCWDHDPQSRPEVSEALRDLLAMSVSHPSRRPCTDRLDPFLMRSEEPAWKQLINHTLATDERVSLITGIFIDRHQVEMVEHLSRSNAQRFIDMIDDVSHHKVPRSKDKQSTLIWTSTIFPLGAGLSRPRSPQGLRALLMWDL